jgi:plasmid maintenance system antidote protein VapI
VQLLFAKALEHHTARISQVVHGESALLSNIAHANTAALAVKIGDAFATQAR